MVASKSKGKSGNYFGYYHCSRGHKYFGVNSQEFESAIANYLNKLEAKPGFLPLFREVVRDVWIQKNRGSKQEKEQTQKHLEELKTRQETLIDRIPDCESKIVQNRLEQQVDGLQATIEDLKVRLQNTTIKTDDIDAYFAIAKSMMEHPRKYVFDAQTKEKLEKIWSFIFCTNPTYSDLCDETPDLTLIYRLNQDSNFDQNRLAGQLSAQWNTFEQEILKELDKI